MQPAYHGLPMLTLTVHMNSGIQEILEFKCCNLSNLNLEIIVHNRGERPAAMPSSFALENDRERRIFKEVYPPWPQTVQPGDCCALYGAMDETIWNRYRRLVITDTDGNEVGVPTEPV
jgi:hypothetical protein